MPKQYCPHRFTLHCLLTLCCLAVVLSVVDIPNAPLAKKVAAQVPPTPQSTPQAEKEWDPTRQGVGDLTEGPRTEVAPKFRKPVKIIGKRFTQQEFAHYVRTSVVPVLKQRGHWRPSFIVLHNTGVPSIRQRRDGFTDANMTALARYYGVNQGWSSGPHLFVDQNG